MTPARIPAALPGLARLLAAESRERLEALARLWGIDGPVGPGLAGRLYQGMVAPGRIEAVLAAQTDPERLAFAQALRIDRPVTRDDLLRSLPFAEDHLDRLMGALELSGLLWRCAATGRSSGESQRQWLIPRDLRLALLQNHPVGRTTVPEPRLPSPPALVPFGPAPSDPHPAGLVLRLISGRAGDTATAPMMGLPAPWSALGSHFAVRLGVWLADRSPGPRSDAWARIPDDQRVRALARLWLVDDTVPKTLSLSVPIYVRHALWEALHAAPAEQWYTLDSVARRVAWHAAHAPGRPGSLARRDIEIGIEVLAFLGVLGYAADTRGRPIALCLTPNGRSALIA